MPDMNPDYTGTLLGAAACSTALTVFLALFQILHRELRGLSWWTASSTLAALSMILYATRATDWHGEAHYSPSLVFLGIWCPGVWICASGACMLQGFREILGHTGGLRLSGVLLGCQIIVFSALVYPWPHMAGRVFSIAVFLFGICLASAITVHRHAQPEIRGTAKAVTVMFLLLAAGYAVRAFLSGGLLLGNEQTDLLIDSRATFILSSAVNALWIVSGITIALQRDKLLSNQRHEAQKSRENLTKLENYRARLSRDIHDMFSGTLATITVLSSEKIPPDEAPAQLQHIHSLSSQSVSELRSLLNNLSAPESDLRRWGAELHEMATRLTEAAGIALEFEATGFDHRPLGEPLAGVNLRRAIHEALNNAIRHARPSRISLTAIAGMNRITITIADDGPGFPPQEKHGFGLANMASRANELGGSMSPTSSLGATIQFETPHPLFFHEKS